MGTGGEHRDGWSGPPLLTPTTPPRFVCKNSGVLFENQLLQIGVKSEFRQNLGVSWWPRGGMGVLKGWDC